MSENLHWVLITGLPVPNEEEVRVCWTTEMIDISKKREGGKLPLFEVMGTPYALHYRGVTDGEETFYAYPISTPPNPITL